MSKQVVSIRLDDEVVAMLDERAAQESITRAELIEFALKPMMEQKTVRPLMLPAAVNAMLEKIAVGQGVDRTAVMRRALIDYAARAATRWQINARTDQKPQLVALAAEIEKGVTEAPPSAAPEPL
jgi:predicted transcriptional regulator